MGHRNPGLAKAAPQAPPRAREMFAQDLQAPCAQVT